MRVPRSWLDDWVSTDLDSEMLAERLTTLGLEVDSVTPAADAFSGVVVAEVLGAEQHPNADRLTLCQVTTGGQPIQIVCGAPNVRVGMKGALATIGAVLPDATRIKASKLRGVESQGMLCSARELGLGDDGGGILALAADAPIGADLRDYLALDDAVIDLDLTPNRGDCFSVLGVAREVAANLQCELKEHVPRPVPAALQDEFPTRLITEAACPRFVGRIIRGVAARASSPAWLKERLRRAGMRSIHPVVDVTNYVMLEFGQPLHGYDLGKLTDEIQVRWARPQEGLHLLDGRQVVLDEDMLVIADGSGAIALAGIMGGQSTAVDDQTHDVFLEAAFFSVDAIAGRARRLGLHTDASLRFERGVDPTHQARAIERATDLLIDIAGGEPGPLTEVLAEDCLPNRPTVTLRHQRLQRVLGMELSSEIVESTLGRLQMNVESSEQGCWAVTPPAFRFDIAIEEDLIEEVARLVGYDEIPRTPVAGAAILADSSELSVPADNLVDILVARGYQEVITYSFVDAALQQMLFPNSQPVVLANPISQEMDVMRRSLWPGLLATARANIHRQHPHQRLFEVGHQFEQSPDGVVETPVLAGLATGSRYPERWANPREEVVDFYDVKGDLEALLARTGYGATLRFATATHPALRPGQTAKIHIDGRLAGWLGVLHPAHAATLDLDQSVVLFALRLEEAGAAQLPHYVRHSKFPALRRDLAFVVDEDVPVETLVAEVREAAGGALRDVVVFDVYRGPAIDSSRKSIALGLILQETSRTLTDEDAEGTVGSVIKRLATKLGATIRN